MCTLVNHNHVYFKFVYSVMAPRLLHWENKMSWCTQLSLCRVVHEFLKMGIIAFHLNRGLEFNSSVRWKIIEEFSKSSGFGWIRTRNLPNNSCNSWRLELASMTSEVAEVDLVTRGCMQSFNSEYSLPQPFGPRLLHSSKFPAIYKKLAFSGIPGINKNSKEIDKKNVYYSCCKCFCIEEDCSQPTLFSIAPCTLHFAPARTGTRRNSLSTGV